MTLLTAPPLLEGTRSSGVYSIISLVPYEPHQNTTQSMLQQLVDRLLVLTSTLILTKSLPALWPTTSYLSQTTSQTTPRPRDFPALSLD